MNLALFHPAFRTLGGAEILAATQARCLRDASLDLCIVTLELDCERWKPWLEGIPVRLVEKAPFIDQFMTRLGRLRRAVPRVETCLTDCHTVLACNYPTNVLLGAADIKARKVWSCNEPARDSHLAGANPRLHARITEHPGGTTAAEIEFLRVTNQARRTRSSRLNAALCTYDIEQTRRIDSMCAISEFSRNTVGHVYGRTDVEVIYPIVRFPTGNAIHRAGLDRRGLQILTHSRLEAVKNIDTILRGFAIHVAKHIGARLHIVGTGREEENLKQLCQSLALGDSVVFHGYLPDKELNAVYAACDVFALLPLDEPFGMVYPEAAARGLLLVAPDHGGPFEIIDGGKLGWACDPFAPESLAEVFEQIWGLSDASVDQRRELTDRSCRTRFGEGTIGPQLVKLLSG